MTVKRNSELEYLCIDIREEILKCIASVGTGHVGGSLSIVELLAVLYGKEMKYDSKNPNWEGRDYLVLSKGHAGPAVYSVLALKGFFPKEMLYTLNKPGTMLPSHTDRNRTPGVDMTTGSLGQGASTAMGVAYSLKIDSKDNYVYLILGDGECNEGQVWEAALFAAHNKLDNIITFVDMNKKQVDGLTKNICDMGDLACKFNSFGCYTQFIDGHDVDQILNAISNAQKTKDKPSVIILDTIKGKGLKEIEDKWNCHSMNISSADLSRFIEELEEQRRAI